MNMDWMIIGGGLVWGVIMGTVIGEVIVNSYCDCYTDRLVHDITNHTYKGLGNGIIQVDTIIQCAIQHNNLQVLEDIALQYNAGINITLPNGMIQILHGWHRTLPVDTRP